MKWPHFPILIALPISLFGLAISGCSPQASEPSPTAGAPTASPSAGPQLLPAPYHEPETAVRSIGVNYTLAEIVVAEDEVCPLDNEGRLLVFAEDVFGDRDGTFLKSADITIHPGDKFFGSDVRQDPEEFTCGGVKYKVTRITEPGLFMYN